LNAPFGDGTESSYLRLTGALGTYSGLFMTIFLMSRTMRSPSPPPVSATRYRTARIVSSKKKSPTLPTSPSVATIW
jgi:hypothetical protein